jgi:hypothetical protein
MSLKQFDPEDIVHSLETITATAWSVNDGYITSCVASDKQPDSGFFLNVSETGTPEEVEFSVAYGHISGLNTEAYTDISDPELDKYSPSRSVYHQYMNLIYPNDNEAFIEMFPEDFFVINVERSRYKERLLPESLKITIDTEGWGTDIEIDDEEPIETEAGPLYIINSEKGWFLPNVGLILVKDITASGPVVNLFTNFATHIENFYLKSEEILSSNFYFIRGRNQEFNYSENPSFKDPDGTGDLRFPQFALNPKTYVTTVGLYSDDGELLAVAKLSKPLLKDFSREFLIRAKISF